MTEREMTKEEKRWWSLFKRIIKAMPPSLELSVYNSTISVSAVGSRQAAFDKDGCADNTADLDFVRAGRVYPNGEAL